MDADPGVSHYLRFYPGAGTAIFSDPEAQSENWAWASLGTPTEIKKVTVSSGNDNGNGNGTANKRRSKTSIGQFVLYGQDGNVRNRIPISADDSREEIAKKYHEIRDQIPALRDG